MGIESREFGLCRSDTQLFVPQILFPLVKSWRPMFAFNILGLTFIGFEYACKPDFELEKFCLFFPGITAFSLGIDIAGMKLLP